MGPMRILGRGALPVFLCLALAFWSILPMTGHAPKLIDTLQDHAERVADHGHSHGLEEDIYWSLHGHDHEVGDHDHSPAVLVLAEGVDHDPLHRDHWRLLPPPDDPSRIFRIERPPRA